MTPNQGGYQRQSKSLKAGSAERHSGDFILREKITTPITNGLRSEWFTRELSCACLSRFTNHGAIKRAAFCKTPD